jgi:tetratricopeptide (TPR) repeat protein
MNYFVGKWNTYSSASAAALLSLVLVGCSSKANVVHSNANTAVSTEHKEKLETVIAHSTENAQQPPMPTPDTSGAPRSQWTQGGDPIDTSKYDAAINEAEKELKQASARRSNGGPNVKTADQALSEAYFNRAVALTDARQYASALGDYRRALKYDANNEEAKNWISQIISIYDSMNKQYPPEGQEPPPLPLKK